MSQRWATAAKEIISQSRLAGEPNPEQLDLTLALVTIIYDFARALPRRQVTALSMMIVGASSDLQVDPLWDEFC